MSEGKIMSEEQAETLPLICQIAKLELKPGDMLVLMHPKVLHRDAFRRIGDVMCEALRLVGLQRKDVPILILEEGMTLSVLSTEELRKRTL